MARTSYRRPASFRLYAFSIGALLVAAFAVVYFWYLRDHQLAQARESRLADIERGPRVPVVAVGETPRQREITLLGDARPYQTATLYSKVGGYLKAVRVDKGDKVEAGQILAEIESAETDSQYARAVDDLENKRRLAARARDLLARGNTSTQQAEQAQTDARMAEANVAQLATVKSYETLRAPFGGTVTARYVDPGALVQNAENNQTSSQPVLTVTDGSRLRVGVYLEQRDVPLVHVGDPAEVVDAASPERRVEAKVSRTAGELDPRTRTLLVEVDVDNSKDFLVAGSFAYVTLRMPVPSFPQIPVGALVMRGAEPFVATVSEDGHVQFRAVKLGQTDGSLVAVTEGLQAGDLVARDVPDEVTDGSRIQPVKTATR
ncbi:MAG TPA: efflux RND transporter periplasmic adaptor subunit [Stellaceae bacterium]